MGRFEALLRKYRANRCTSEEMEELFAYFDGDLNVAEIKEAIEQQLNERGTLTAELRNETNEIFHRIKRRVYSPTRSNGIRAYRWWAAAAMLLCCSLAGYHLIHSGFSPVTDAREQTPMPIVAGGNRATLTLANGETILLTNSANGQLAQEGNVAIQKIQEGQLVYTSAGDSNEATGTNQLTTPNGGIYDVVLSDGSHVWLNAASTLNYPTAFTGDERWVELSGEAYFEIAPDAKPFKVISQGQTIQVLGTAFNVEAYADGSAIQTTLLQGAVKLSYRHRETSLKPGEMVVNDLKGELQVKPADGDKVLAWKNGLFVFNNESIADIMRKAARWYDVEVVYEGKIADKKLWGTVSRYQTINELLDNIALAGGIRYRIEGRRVILMK